VDREKQTVRLSYASGAPASGFHELQFKSDGQGGTVLKRHGELQDAHGVELGPDGLKAEARRMDAALSSIANRGHRASDILAQHGRR
jgi:hypothetical protein